MPPSNRLPTGPGSRGGRWSIDPEYRRAYYRAWRAAHPDYRDRERLRRARTRDAVGDVELGDRRALPLPAVHCVCECGCGESVTVVCGFCRDGLHSA